MTKTSKKIYRGTIYTIGMISLAFGIVLNTKSQLGAAPIATTPLAVAEMTGLQFGDLAMGLYIIFAIIEFVIKGKSFKKFDLLQIPFCYLFTRCMNFFSSNIIFDIHSPWQSFAIMLVGVLCTGVGVAMSVEMRLVPNPSDGLVQVISDRTGVKLGLTKNIFDAVCVTIAVSVGLIFAGRVIGVGVGTICALLGIGRVVAIFNHLFKDKMLKRAFESGDNNKSAKKGKSLERETAREEAK